MSDKITPRLPRTFWFLFAGALVNRIGSFVMPLFALYLTGERGYSPSAAGVICSLYGLGSLVSGTIGGQLADRIGRRPTMLLGFVWGGFAMLIVPFADSHVAIGAAALHLGLAGDLYRPAIQAAVSDICTPVQRPRAYGLLYWAVNLGFAGATAMGGLLARRGFGMLFVIDAATTFAFAIVVALFIPETRPQTAPRTDDAAPSMWAPFADRVLVRFISTQCLVGFIFLQSQVALPVALAQRGITAERYGFVIALNGVLIVLLQPVALRLVTRMRRTRALAWGALLIGAGFAANALPFGVGGAAFSVVIWTCGELIFSPIVPSVVADLAPDGLRGRYQGMNQMAYGVCALVGPTGGMALFEHGGANAVWATCLVFGAIAAALHLQSARGLAARLLGKGAPA